MTKNLVLSLFALSLVMTTSAFQATAGELDSENGVTNVEQRTRAAELPGTVVVRVSQADNSVEVLHSKDILTATADAQKLVNDGAFVKMDINSSMKSELDKDSSSSSWYFWFYNNNCYAPTYYYYGYTYYYQPYYTYSYNYYYYYWYRW